MAYDPVASPLHKLLLGATRYNYPKGQVVHAFDDRTMLNLIESGYIKRYRITHEGTKSIQVIYGPNDIFPLTPVYHRIYEMAIYRGPETYYYEAMTNLVIYSVNHNVLMEAVAADPVLYKDLFYAAGTRLNSYIHRLEDVALRTSSWRVAHQLIYLANEFGQTSDAEITIMLPLTHQDLADVLSLTRETVSRELAKLKAKGLITGGKNIVIPDLERLKDIYR